MLGLLPLGLYCAVALLICLPGHFIYTEVLSLKDRRPTTPWVSIPPLEVYFAFSLVVLLPIMMFGMFFHLSITTVLLVFTLLILAAIVFNCQQYGIQNLLHSLTDFVRGLPLMMGIFTIFALFAWTVNVNLGTDALEAVSRASNSLDELDLLFRTAYLGDGIRVEMTPLLIAFISKASGIHPFHGNFANGVWITFLSGLAWFRLFYTMLGRQWISLILALVFFALLNYYHSEGFFELLSYESTTMVTFMLPMILRFAFIVITDTSLALSEQYGLSLLILLSGTWHKCLILHLGWLLPLSFLGYWIFSKWSHFKNLFRISYIYFAILAIGVVLATGKLIQFGLHEDQPWLTNTYYIGSIILFSSTFIFVCNRKNRTIDSLFKSRIGFFLPTILTGVFLYLTSLSDEAIYSEASLLGAYTIGLHWGKFILLHPSTLGMTNLMMLGSGIILCSLAPQLKVRQFSLLLFCYVVAAFFMMFFPPLTTLITKVSPLWTLDRIRYHFWVLAPFALTLGTFSQALRLAPFFTLALHLLLTPLAVVVLALSVQARFPEERIKERIQNPQALLAYLDDFNERNQRDKRINALMLNNSYKSKDAVGNEPRPFDDPFYRYNALRAINYVRSDDTIDELVRRANDPYGTGSEALYIIDLYEADKRHLPNREIILQSKNFHILYHDENIIILEVSPYPWSKVEGALKQKFKNKKDLTMISNRRDPLNARILDSLYGKPVKFHKNPNLLAQILNHQPVDSEIFEGIFLLSLEEDEGRYRGFDKILPERSDIEVLYADPNYIFFTLKDQPLSPH